MSSTTDKDLQCREIIVKAVCGKGRKFSQATHAITPNHSPSTILGAWIINHTYDAEKAGDVIEVIGSYDINIWYSYDNNTKTEVTKETVSYVEQVPLSYLDNNHRGPLEVHAQATQQPNCIEAAVASTNDAIIVKVEREFAVEVIGETKVCVVVCPGGCDEIGDKDFDFAGEAGEGEGYDDLDPDIIIDDLD
ncbi:outer spore coat protein CotE [Bacillaceae bacterium]